MGVLGGMVVPAERPRVALESGGGGRWTRRRSDLPATAGESRPTANFD